MDNLNILDKSINMNDEMMEKKIYIDRDWIDIDKNVGMVSDVIIHMNTYSISKLIAIEENFKVLIRNKDYSVVGNSIVLYKEFISTLREGKNTITFIFNNNDERKVCINIIEDKDVNLNLIMGKANGERGDRIVVPIMIEGIIESGLNAFNFSLSFDNKRFSNIKIFPGSICVNPEVTLFTDINEENGIISIMYCDSVGDGTEAIYKDGIFIELEMNIKEEAPFGDSEINMNQIGIFADINDLLYNLNFQPALITVDGLINAEIVTPNTTFDLNDFVDLYVDIIFNENILEKITLGDTILNENMDYVVNGDNVVLRKEFLKTLEEGKKEFVFEFEECEDILLYVDIFRGNKKIKVEINDVSVAKGTTVVAPVTIEGVTEEKLSAFNFALSYDNNKIKNVSVIAKDICINPDVTLFSDVNENDGTISIMYCDSKGDGSESICEDGPFVDIEFDVNSNIENDISSFVINDSGVFVDSEDKLYDLRFIGGNINIEDESREPELITESIEVDMDNLKDIEVELMFNGNSLVSIDDGNTKLENDKDYVIKDNIVILNKEYLKSLNIGTTPLIFQFTYGQNKILMINVSKSVENLQLSIGSAKGKHGEKVILPISLSGVTENKLGTINFSIKYNTSKFENINIIPRELCVNPESTLFADINRDSGIIVIRYFDTSGTGMEAISKDGVFIDLEMDICKNAEVGVESIKLSRLGIFADMNNSLYEINVKAGLVNILEGEIENKEIVDDKLEHDIDNKSNKILDLNVCSVLGKQGSKVTVPVIFKGITSEKLSAFNFSLKYDNSKFENVKVISQGSCINPEETLFSAVNNEAGIISIMYCDSTGTGIDSISQDGVFLNLEFDIKENSEIEVSDITLNKLGVFTDAKGGLYNVNFIGGSISILKSQERNSTINKSIDKFDKEEPFDIIVDMNLNGNNLAYIVNRDEILLKGRDYLVKGETVIITKEYLEILPLGEEVLTFKFSSGKDQILMINIDQSEPKLVDAEININSSVFDLANPLEIPIRVVLNGNCFRDIKHGALTLNEGKDYILEGNTIVLTKRYLESMDVGVKLLNINFTSGQSIPFTVNVIDSMEDEGKFSINVASIEAKAGDIITIPVYVRGTPKQGVEAFDFRLSYEGQFLDVIDVKSGEVIINADKNLKYYSNTKRHLIYVTYIDYECLGNDAIQCDGVLLYVTFKIKDETSRGPVKVEPNNDDPVFSDFDGNNYEFDFNGGVITVI